MLSTLRRQAAPLLLLSMLLTAPGCASSGGYPSRALLRAATEAKPIPGDEIVTDPVASARYNAEVEGWGDRLYVAGAGLCRFFKDTGMKGLDCPK